MPQKEKKIEELQRDARGLIQMYQAGFLDGYRARIASRRKKAVLICADKSLFMALRKDCEKAFKIRFVKKFKKIADGS